MTVELSVPMYAVIGRIGSEIDGHDAHLAKNLQKADLTLLKTIDDEGTEFYVVGKYLDDSEPDLSIPPTILDEVRQRRVAREHEKSLAEEAREERPPWEFDL